MAKKHFSFLDSVSRIAGGDWGQSFDSEDEADKALIGNPEKLAAYTLLEMLARFSKVCGEFAVDNYAPSEYSESLRERPEYAEQCSNVEIGEKMYGGELLDGLTESIACGRDQDGYLLVVRVAEDNHWAPRVRYASSGLSTSLADAVKIAAENDIDYHGKRYQYARDALEAVASGGDLSRFLLEPSEDDLPTPTP